MRLLPALFCLVLLPAAADPLKSAACDQALAQLQAAREARASIESSRQRAVQACLGGAGPAAPRANRWAQQPIAVPPPIIEPPARPPAVAAPAQPPAAVAIERPRTLSGCDANGCWVNDGTRLQHIGPHGMGPSGLCALQGGLPHCP